MSTPLNGSDLILFLGATPKPIAFSTGHKISLKGKTREISSKDSGKWDEKVMGRLGWSISADALACWDVTSYNYDDMYAAFLSQAVIAVKSCLATGVIGALVPATTNFYTGNALITSLDLDAKDDSNGTFSITLEGTGPLTLTP